MTFYFKLCRLKEKTSVYGAHVTLAYFLAAAPEFTV